MNFYECCDLTEKIYLRYYCANHLVKSFVANVALECLLTRVGQSVVFVVAFLVESFAAKFADKRFVPHVDSHVSVEG